MFGQSFVSDAAANPVGALFQFVTPFPSTPSLITQTTIGSDSNAPGVALFSVNEFGANAVITPSVPGAFTKAHRKITATF